MFVMANWDSTPDLIPANISGYMVYFSNGQLVMHNRDIAQIYV